MKQRDWNKTKIRKPFKSINILLYAMERHVRMNGKIIVGLTENISFTGRGKELAAKIDTGATRSSIDLKLASKLNLGPVIKSKMIKGIKHGSRDNR